MKKQEPHFVSHDLGKWLHTIAICFTIKLANISLFVFIVVNNSLFSFSLKRLSVISTCNTPWLFKWEIRTLVQVACMWLLKGLSLHFLYASMQIKSLVPYFHSKIKPWTRLEHTDLQYALHQQKRRGRGTWESLSRDDGDSGWHTASQMIH